MMPNILRPFHSLAFASRAFSLVEVAVALGIVAVCVTALVGLFSMGINANRESTVELQAAHLGQSIISTLRTTGTNNLGASFPIPPLTVGASGSTASATVKLDIDGKITTSSSQACYGLSYELDSPASGERKPFKLHLCIFWPAQASSAKMAAGRYELVTSLPAP